MPFFIECRRENTRVNYANAEKWNLCSCIAFWLKS